MIMPSVKANQSAYFFPQMEIKSGRTKRPSRYVKPVPLSTTVLSMRSKRKYGACMAVRLRGSEKIYGFNVDLSPGVELTVVLREGGSDTRRTRTTPAPTVLRLITNLLLNRKQKKN